MEILAAASRGSLALALALAPQLACGGKTPLPLGSGESEAGGPDAGGPRAGGPDAGGRDAGGPRAGGPDAGGPDAGGAAPKCGPTPTELVDFNALATQTGLAASEAMQLAVDETDVYFVFARQLMRVPIRGGTVSTMLSLEPVSLDSPGSQNFDPSVTSTMVALHDPVDDEEQPNEPIVAVPKEGGAATTLATSAGFVTGFAADENNVYFADPAGVHSVSMAGGDLRLLTGENDLSVLGLAVVGPNLVLAAGAGLLSIPVQGGPLTTLLDQPNAMLPLACDSDPCWWMVTGYDTGAIGRLSDAGVTTVTAGPAALSIAFDGTSFYETDACLSMMVTLPGSCTQPLLRIPASGGAVVQLMPATFVAVDDECVYFSIFFLPTNRPAENDGVQNSGIYSVAK
jgi:hypothetical protein